MLYRRDEIGFRDLQIEIVAYLITPGEHSEVRITHRVYAQEIVLIVQWRRARILDSLERFAEDLHRVRETS